MSGEAIMVRVRNGGIYAFTVQSVDGSEWVPWSLSEHADLVRAAKAEWALAHPRPDRWLGDVPPGTYELRDCPPRLVRPAAVVGGEQHG
jgi:hypothetical protein